MRYCSYFYIMVCVMLSGCDVAVLNSPYSDDESNISTLYSSFSLRPKHLDPARSYGSNEVVITGQVYEPPFQYHYLKRPYSLIPLTAEKMPTVKYFNTDNEIVTVNDSNIAYSTYDISIKPGIYYQPHPAFMKTSKGDYSYHQLSVAEAEEIKTIADFKQQGTRELIAADYVYQIKRLAHPELHSPIIGLMVNYIVGLGDYAKQLRTLQQQDSGVDLLKHDISGVKIVDRYTYQIKVNGKYPQLKYWLAMPFFSPVPWEADVFYDQKVLIDKNISLDLYPVGTGPYQLTENNPNLRMVLEKNPNYHQDFYPKEGEQGDELQGLLQDAGKQLPLIDKVVFTLEKESISYWNKFLQGYYDISGISSDSFDQAIQMADSGALGLSDAMKEKGIQLKTTVEASMFYTGFNMNDPVVGGYDEHKKSLRLAISITVDQEEYISIFMNGRGIAAQGPIPPGIYGYSNDENNFNTQVYNWDNGTAVRKSITEAKKLLTLAGYPEGRSATTGEPLILYFDTTGSGPGSKARFDWIRKQFQKIDIQLVIRETDYNRFQDKIKTGQAQIFQWGWNADYPDPENFLFLLYGPNSKQLSGGENSANYSNDRFDFLFEQMRLMPDGEERLVIINEMLDILRQDSPWIWGFHPKNFALYHSWNSNIKPNLMANNTLKYRKIDTSLRESLQNEWNKPIIWPLLIVIIAGILLVLPAWLMYLRKKNLKISEYYQ